MDLETFLQLIVNGLVAGSTYALFALGFTLMFATLRFLPLNCAAAYTGGAYCTYSVSVSCGAPLWLSAVVAVGCCALGGAGCEKLLHQPLRNRRATDTGLLLAMLGVVIAFQSLVSLVFGDHTVVLRPPAATRALRCGNVRFTDVQLVSVAVCAALGLSLWIIQKRTRLGVLQRALAGDVVLARTVGIEPGRVYLFVCALAFALVGAAGVIAGLDTDLVPTMGFSTLLLAITASVIGGMGSTGGAAVGGLFIGVLQQMSAWALPTEWQDAIVFSVLIGFLIVRPQGLCGAPLRKTTV